MRQKTINNMTVDFIGGFIRWLAKGCRTNFWTETSSDNYRLNLLWALGASVVLIFIVLFFI
jgi:hypothetical protein